MLARATRLAYGGLRPSAPSAPALRCSVKKNLRALRANLPMGRLADSAVAENRVPSTILSLFALHLIEHIH